MAATTPNLLVLSASHLRADFLSCYGNSQTKTSYIDRIAREGVQFTNCYCASPLSAASRISFATSSYVSDHNHRGPGGTISARVPSIASILKRNGYRTGFFGENDCFAEDALPKLFDEYFLPELGSMEELPEYEYAHSAFSLPDDHPFNLEKAVSDHGNNFISGSLAAEAPFFAWISFRQPSPPYACPPPYDYLFDRDEVSLPKGWPAPEAKWEPRRNEVWRTHSQAARRREGELRDMIATYMGSVRYVDDLVGRALKTLEEKDALGNTVVLFLSDHGDLLGYRGMTHAIPVYYEGLTRIPALARFPGQRWKGRRFGGLTEMVDLVPTVLEAMDVEVPPTMAGRSYVLDLDLDQDPGRDAAIVEGGIGGPMLQEPSLEQRQKFPRQITWNGLSAMIRKDNWKLCFYIDDTCELFDLENDPDELNNLYEKPDYIDMREELTTDLLRRVLSTKLRRVVEDWPLDRYPIDVRREPLEKEIPSSPPMGGGTPRRTVLMKGPLPTSMPKRKRQVTRSLKLTKAPVPTRQQDEETTDGPAEGEGAPLNRILFVGTRNTFRSRFAEAFFNYYADILNINYSCFSRALDKEAGGEPITEVAEAAMRERDINPKFASVVNKPLTENDLYRADRIIAISETEHRPLMKERFPDWADRIEYWDAAPSALNTPPEETTLLIEKEVTDLIKSLDQME